MGFHRVLFGTGEARGAVEIWEVSPDVGNVRNNRPDLMERAALL